MRFGYLPLSDLETGNLRTEESVRDALRRMQNFAGLAPTGRIDSATARLLASPRCGVPDELQGAWANGRRPKYRPYRSKRYTLQGLKWDYTNLTWRSVGVVVFLI